MASLANQYDPEAGVPSDREFEVFEAGNYPMEVIESDIVPTKAGTGKLFKYRLRITEGEQEDKLVFGQMNLQNPNPVATKIGQEEFRALREVVGVLEPEDTQDLHFKQFVGVVKITPAKGEFKAKNEVNWGATYKLFSGEEVAPPKAANDNKPATSTATVAKATPAAGAPKKAAWPRKAA